MNLMDLQALAEKIPLATDRALVEIVNHTESAIHLADHRAGQGFFRRHWSRLTGADRKREVQGAQAVAASQRQTVELVRELGEQLSFTNLNVALVATRLDELARETEDSGRLARQNMHEVSALASVVASLVDGTTRRLDSVERRLDAHAARLETHDAALLELERRQVHLELWQASRDTLDTVLRRWQAHGVYRSLPWPCQVLLLARQLAAGKPGEHESATGDRTWRERLADEALADAALADVRGRLGWREDRLPLVPLLSYLLDELPRADDRLMVAELLGAGVPGMLRPPHAPLALVMARTLERAVHQPEDPVEVVIGQARQDTACECEKPAGMMTVQEFVRWAVDEQAEAARVARGRLAPGLPPGSPRARAWPHSNGAGPRPLPDAKVGPPGPGPERSG
ncbi:hypothetical protein IQ62_44360 [Streptomyces scabiei]|uniref:hypothetical protein n=1 Tax=Streptomyces scabiei TaxID=1930 RepID=UPI0004E6ED4A|nr:hypothetical protein [Streptomyces scabiei]KFF95123.1 hypothetical protein IQ62_44360 [Streptomyces scabiei]